MPRFPICIVLAVAASATASWASPPLCGGIGQDEQQRMKDAARDHDLMLTFATANGSYLADVAVQVVDSRGAPVVDGSCSGPIMLIDLPAPGTYRVTARAGGVVRERSVTLTRAKRPASATLTWPDGTS